MLLDDLLHLLLLSSLDLSAIITNSLYIFIIIRNLGNVSGFMVLVYIGPCTLVNAQLCHLIMAIHANLVVLSVILLMVSFAYRLWVLRESSMETKKAKGLWWTAAQSLLMTLVILNAIVFFKCGTYSVPGFSDSLTYSAVQISKAISGSRLIAYPFIPLFLLLLIYFCGFISIIFIRRRLLSRIRALRSADRHSHQSIYRSLMAQMTLPIAYLFAFTIWILDLLGVVHSRTLERTILVASSLFALLSPLINMHYIPPYRKFLKSIFSGSKISTMKTINTPTTSEQK